MRARITRLSTMWVLLSINPQGDGVKPFSKDGCHVLICLCRYTNPMAFSVSTVSSCFKLQTARNDCVWNVMAHAQKPDFFFRRNGRVHLNRQEDQFSRLMAGELYTSACRVCTARASLCSAVMWHLLVTHSISCFPFTSPPVRHRVPSHFNWTIPNYVTWNGLVKFTNLWNHSLHWLCP